MIAYYVVKQCKLNKLLLLCESGTGSFRNELAEQISWAVICFTCSRKVLCSYVHREEFLGISRFPFLRSGWKMSQLWPFHSVPRSKLAQYLRLLAFFPEVSYSNLIRNPEYSECGFSWYFPRHLQMTAEKLAELRPLNVSSFSLPVYCSLSNHWTVYGLLWFTDSTVK